VEKILERLNFNKPIQISVKNRPFVATPRIKLIFFYQKKKKKKIKKTHHALERKQGLMSSIQRLCFPKDQQTTSIFWD
jgi:hypothetical protein